MTQALYNSGRFGEGISMAECIDSLDRVGTIPAEAVGWTPRRFVRVSFNLNAFPALAWCPFWSIFGGDQ
jgi:hypothetical protein